MRGSKAVVALAEGDTLTITTLDRMVPSTPTMPALVVVLRGRGGGCGADLGGEIGGPIRRWGR
ncbi:hypothetical protein GCM10009696_00730 [Kocuria himachalensis]